jgi:hypothetical protein
MTRDITECPPAVIHITETIIRTRTKRLRPNDAIDVVHFALVHKTVPGEIDSRNFLPLKDIQGVYSSCAMSMQSKRINVT